MFKWDKIVFAGLLLVVAAMAITIWRSPDQETDGRFVIAHVTEVEGEAKVKSHEDIGWKILQEGHALIEKDRVFTLDQSHMQLKFYDGTVLNLTPNTLLIIVREGETIDIDLQKGFLGLKLNEVKNQLMVRLGEKHIGVSGSKTRLHVSMSENKSSNITVVSGEANVSYKGQQVELKKGQKIDLLESATKIDVTKFGIDPTLPDAEKIYFQEESTQVNLAWESETKHDSYQVIAARDPQFQDVIKNEKVMAKNTSLQVKDEGHYYWKVKGMTGKQEVSEAPVSTFQATRDGPPHLLFPSLGEVFLIDPATGKKSVTLRWEDNRSKDFEIEFFRDGLDNKGELLQVAGQDYLELPDLAEQEYKWRVRANTEARPDSPWSDYRTFLLREKEFENIPGQQGSKRRQEYYDEKSGKWIKR